MLVENLNLISIELKKKIPSSLGFRDHEAVRASFQLAGISAIIEGLTDHYELEFSLLFGQKSAQKHIRKWNARELNPVTWWPHLLDDWLEDTFRGAIEEIKAEIKAEKNR